MWYDKRETWIIKLKILNKEITKLKLLQKWLKTKDLYINVTFMLHMSQINYNIKIVEVLLKSENHIRRLARLIGTNQTTIARKVHDLYKENIIDFKQEGKNKVFYIKKTLEARQYVNFVETYKLLETLKRYPRLRRIIEQIKKNQKISLAILFGSYAKGTASKESDIDIYIDTTDNKIKEEVELIDSKISVKIGNYNKDSLLIKEIEKAHTIIKGVELYYEKNKLFD